MMGTEHHAAVVARVEPGKAAAVVGDGAVGLRGIVASKRLGAERIMFLGRHLYPIALGRAFGPTDIVWKRADEAIAKSAS
jgi:threonine dehydrogenase-like Zn-dependent dehydrogenase